jgi:hypothetical protein
MRQVVRLYANCTAIEELVAIAVKAAQLHVALRFFASKVHCDADGDDDDEEEVEKVLIKIKRRNKQKLIKV